MASFLQLLQPALRAPDTLGALNQGVGLLRSITQLQAQRNEGQEAQRTRSLLASLQSALGAGAEPTGALFNQLATVSPSAAAQLTNSLNSEASRAVRAVDAQGEILRQAQPLTTIAKELFDSGLRGEKLKGATASALRSREQTRRASASRPGVQVNVSPEGALPLGRAAESKVEKDLLDSLSLSDELEQVVDLGNVDDLLTVQGRATTFSARAADAFGLNVLGSRGRVARRSLFEGRVSQIFNTFRKAITGAAAAESELKRLEKQILNTNMLPTEFKTSLNDLVSKTQRAGRLRFKLLREGFTEDSPATGRRLNALWIRGEQANGFSDRVALFSDFLQEELAAIATSTPGLSASELTIAAEDAAERRVRALGFEEVRNAGEASDGQ